MSDEKGLKQAQAVYKALCERLDEHKWKYTRHDDDLTITCSAQGDDLPIELILEVDSKRKLITFMSQMPFAVPENRRTALAVAVSRVNSILVDGSFDFNYLSGRIIFRLTSSYRESLIGKQLFTYMLSCACYTIDEYNDKFLLLAKNQMSVEEVLDYIN